MDPPVLRDLPRLGGTGRFPGRARSASGASRVEQNAPRRAVKLELGHGLAVPCVARADAEHIVILGVGQRLAERHGVASAWQGQLAEDILQEALSQSALVQVVWGAVAEASSSDVAACAFVHQVVHHVAADAARDAAAGEHGQAAVAAGDECQRVVGSEARVAAGRVIRREVVTGDGGAVRAVVPADEEQVHACVGRVAEAGVPVAGIGAHHVERARRLAVVQHLVALAHQQVAHVIGVRDFARTPVVRLVAQLPAIHAGQHRSAGGCLHSHAVVQQGQHVRGRLSDQATGPQLDIP